MIERIILASASPRRKEILQMLKIPFEIIPSEADEDIDLEMPPEKYVSELAYAKCTEVRKRLEKQGADLSRTLIIGCDTVVC